MSRSKAEVEELLATFRSRGDPFNIAADRETQVILLDAALIRFFEKYKHSEHCDCDDEVQHAAVRAVRHELTRYFKDEKHQDGCNCPDAEMHEASRSLDAMLSLWEDAPRECKKK